MATLEPTGLAIRAHVIGDGRASEANRVSQDAADGLPQRGQFAAREPRGMPRGMYPRAPQTLVGVDSADAAQDVLIKQQSLHHSPPRAERAREFFFCDFQRVEAERRQI